MTKQRRSTANLDRRHFLVGMTATGLAFGYAALPEIKDALAAPAANFEPTAWYSIGRDGKVVVTSARPKWASTSPAPWRKSSPRSWRRRGRTYGVVFASNDPKYNDPVLGVQLTGGSCSTEMNFDAMSCAGAAGRMTLIKAAAEMLGVPEDEFRARGFARPACEIEEEPDLRPDRCERKGEQDLDSGRAQGDHAENAGPAYEGRPFAAATRHSGEDQRHLQIRHRCLRAGHALRQDGAAARALWRHREIGRRQCCQEGSRLHESRRGRR